MKAPGGAINIDFNKAIMYAITAIVVVGGTIIIYRKIRKGFEGIKEGSTSREAGRSVIKTQLSYDDFWYKQAADRLEVAMIGTGTSEKTIYSILGDLKTKSDYYELVKVFGTRKGRPAMWPTPTINGNLITWLETELDSGEMVKVKDILSNIGVTI